MTVGRRERGAAYQAGAASRLLDMGFYFLRILEGRCAESWEIERCRWFCKADDGVTGTWR